MSPEDEEAVQAELAELEREAMVSSPSMSKAVGLYRISNEPAIPSIPKTQRVSLPSAPVEEPTAAEATAAEGKSSALRPSAVAESSESRRDESRGQGGTSSVSCLSCPEWKLSSRPTAVHLVV